MAVPVKGGSTETQIYTYLTSTVGLNKAAAVGVLANIYRESNFQHQAIGDNGTSYGLCQWHDTSTGVGRWTNLKTYCGNNGLNPTTVEGQLAYLYYELRNSYATVLEILRGVPNTGQGCWDAAANWCARFEVPAGYGSWNNGVLTLGSTSKTRGDLARDVFWSEYSQAATYTISVTNKGNLIVEEARKHLGRPYVWGGSDPSTSFDCSGFVYYVYKTAIDYNWSRTTAYYQWKNYGREVSDRMAGDLIFFEGTYTTGETPNISHIGIATGNGDEFIHCGSSNGVAINSLSESYYRSHYHSTKRILSNTETSSGGGPGGSGNPLVEDISTSFTYATLNSYEHEMRETLAYINEQNLSNYIETGHRYGYIVDVVNGGEFKFFVPEYDVDITTSWDDINIIGRSVSIKGYNSTASRSVRIDLVLVAGAGLYEHSRSRSDRVSDLHNDVAFLQSLAYPDYSNAIVLPPPVVMLYLGPHMNMKGVVGNVQARYLKPYDEHLRPMRVELSFTVTHITDNPPDYRDVRNHSFEGSMSGGIIDYSAISDNSEVPTPVESPTRVESHYPSALR